MPERLLNDDITRQLQEVFDQQLKEPVEILFFGQAQGCDSCGDTQQLYQEVTALSDKLSLSVYDLAADAALAQQYHVDKAPGAVLAGRDGDQRVDFGVRLAGIPAGHDFSAFIQDLIMVSNRASGLSEPTRTFLKNLQKPVHLQVFVTPT
jgi:alkyl hydroperoxide reductase subunit AhpF